MTSEMTQPQNNLENLGVDVGVPLMVVPSGTKSEPMSTCSAMACQQKIPANQMILLTCGKPICNKCLCLLYRQAKGFVFICPFCKFQHQKEEIEFDLQEDYNFDQDFYDHDGYHRRGQPANNRQHYGRGRSSNFGGNQNYRNPDRSSCYGTGPRPDSNGENRKPRQNQNDRNQSETDERDKMKANKEKKKSVRDKYTQTLFNNSGRDGENRKQDVANKKHTEMHFLAGMQNVVDDLKSQLVAKDGEIKALREEVRALQPVPTIGIDIGTTNSCVAVVENGAIRTICNERNEYTIRSCVKFNSPNPQTDEDPVEVGASGLSPNTIPCIKRLAGLDYDTVLTEEETLFFPCEIEGDVKSGNPLFIVPNRLNEPPITRVEVFALILEKLKRMAETHFGRKVTNSVITVPAGFGDRQRADILDAASLAGLNVTRLVSETAALIEAYKLRSGDDCFGKRILVVNMGGGVTEVSLVGIDKGGKCQIFEIYTKWFGGEDIDREIARTFFSKVKDRVGGRIENETDVKCKLKESCQRAKEELSSGVKQAEIMVEVNGQMLNFCLSREHFEDIFDGYGLPQLFGLIKQAIGNRHPPNEILLSGGCTRIPMLVAKLQDYFPNAKLCRNVNCGQAVAQGAALLAKNLDDPLVAKPSIQLDLTCQVFDANLNAMIGCSETSVFESLPMRKFTKFPIQSSACDLLVKLFQNGDYELASARFPGRLISNAELVVQFDVNGTLSSCLLLSTDGRPVVELAKTYDGLSRAEMRKIGAKLEKYHQEANCRHRQKEACNKLDKLITYAEGLAAKPRQTSPSNCCEVGLKAKCSEWTKWFDANSNASIDVLTDQYFSIEEHLRSNGFAVPVEI